MALSFKAKSGLAAVFGLAIIYGPSFYQQQEVNDWRYFREKFGSGKDKTEQAAPESVKSPFVTAAAAMPTSSGFPALKIPAPHNTAEPDTTLFAQGGPQRLLGRH